MHRHGFLIVVAGICLGLVGAGIVLAKDPEEMVVKTEEGLHFKLPPDWPVEKRKGVVAPVPVEEYLSRKFAGMESRLRALEQETASLELRFRVLEEHVKRPPKLQSVEDE